VLHPSASRRHLPPTDTPLPLLPSQSLRILNYLRITAVKRRALYDWVGVTRDLRLGVHLSALHRDRLVRNALRGWRSQSLHQRMETAVTAQRYRLLMAGSVRGTFQAWRLYIASLGQMRRQLLCLRARQCLRRWEAAVPRGVMMRTRRYRFVLSRKRRHLRIWRRRVSARLHLRERMARAANLDAWSKCRAYFRYFRREARISREVRCPLRINRFKISPPGCSQNVVAHW
jgi:hypothetical protein